MDMISGEITTLKKIPNLNHKIFRGVSILELRKPRIKKSKLKISKIFFTSLYFKKK